MSKLLNFHKQIISKYLNNDDINELLKINNKLNKYYLSSFNYITLDILNVLNQHEIEQIINLSLNKFPNLKELNLHYIIKQPNLSYLHLKNIITNYINILNYIEKYNENNQNLNINGNQNEINENLNNNINEINKNLNNNINENLNVNQNLNNENKNNKSLISVKISFNVSKLKIYMNEQCELNNKILILLFNKILHNSISQNDKLDIFYITSHKIINYDYQLQFLDRLLKCQLPKHHIHLTILLDNGRNVIDIIDERCYYAYNECKDYVIFNKKEEYNMLYYKNIFLPNLNEIRDYKILNLSKNIKYVNYIKYFPLFYKMIKFKYLYNNNTSIKNIDRFMIVNILNESMNNKNKLAIKINDYIVRDINMGLYYPLINDIVINNTANYHMEILKSLNYKFEFDNKYNCKYL